MTRKGIIGTPNTELLMCRLVPLLIVISCALVAGCGYLDTELEMSDEEWEGSMGYGTGGIGLSGSGHGWGCGRRIVRRGAGRAPSELGGAAGSSGSSVMTLGDMHIYGARVRSADVHANAAKGGSAASPPAPVDWVGHFDEVSSERQNVLLAAWIEGQLEEPEGSSEGSDSPSAERRSRATR